MQKFLNIIYKIFHKRWVATENDKIQEFVVPSKQAKEIAEKIYGKDGKV